MEVTDGRLANNDGGEDQWTGLAVQWVSHEVC
jgi:hypothetical protein